MSLRHQPPRRWMSLSITAAELFSPAICRAAISSLIAPSFPYPSHCICRGEIATALNLFDTLAPTPTPPPRLPPDRPASPRSQQP
ncbi:uncharacterized protein BDV17DRAFT_269306 [Aspergillus undulatus]|uniref:uncharacterized protein n=1 Tax=Aspergillus undulatus TaxID=1810928 RepID=UPI003CCD2767